MPDSTSVNRTLGHKDAPLIQFDDKADVTDAYAFTDYRPGGDDNAATGTYDFEAPGNGPNNYRFDEKFTYKINLSGSEPDTRPATSGTIPGDDTDVGESRDGDDAQLVKIAEMCNLSSVEAARSFIPDIIKVDLDTSAANTVPANRGLGFSDSDSSEASPIPVGFPNGRRFGDDVADIELITLGAGSESPPPSGAGGFPDVPGAATGGGPLGDIPYPIEVYEPLTETQPDSLAGKGNVFDEDDPECLGDGECIF